MDALLTTSSDTRHRASDSSVVTEGPSTSSHRQLPTGILVGCYRIAVTRHVKLSQARLSPRETRPPPALLRAAAGGCATRDTTARPTHVPDTCARARGPQTVVVETIDYQKKYISFLATENHIARGSVWNCEHKYDYNHKTIYDLRGSFTTADRSAAGAGGPRSVRGQEASPTRGRVGIRLIGELIAGETAAASFLPPGVGAAHHLFFPRLRTSVLDVRRVTFTRAPSSVNMILEAAIRAGQLFGRPAAGVSMSKNKSL
ncbi:hypothetical protein EVAR_96273_1 [Eumeta japonica]|uniref:Uncharacterized protein n=1 Tax=Eumeta variegata TaxID=151549 RepID=A0A4C1WMK7_EUMVA|nr:hypothetical protein EVAR_96273_1 [Eumeta japonica]